MRISACEEFARGVRHLRGQDPAGREIGHEARKQAVVIGQELERGVGEDEVGPGLVAGRPAGNVLLDEFSLRRARPRMRQHCVGCVEADRSRVREAAKQEFRAVAWPAAQIVDEIGRGERNFGEKIARRAHPFGLELGVEDRVPVAHRQVPAGRANGPGLALSQYGR